MPRMLGRILSLGFPLPGPLVDNYNIVSAPAFFDYDALVVDPALQSRVIEELLSGAREGESFAGLPVRNAPPAPGTASLGGLLLQRADETRALLERGGVIVCFAVPADVHHGIDGADPYGDDAWLAPAALAGAGVCVVAADGTRVAVTDYEHPLAAFVDAQSANIAYRAYVECGPGTRVFAESAGGKPLAVDVPAPSGRVVLLPALREPPPGEGRYAMSETLQAGIRRLLGVQAEGREPPWADDARIPGLDERRASLDAAKSASDAADDGYAAAERSYAQLGRWRALLWQEGAIGLDAVVADALRLLGLELYVGTQGELEARGEPPLLIEIDAGERAIEMAAHHRLRQRLERAIEARGTAPRGLLLVNGFRLRAPDQRPQQVSDAVRIAAETQGYCVATTASLFDAVVAALEGRADDVAAYVARLRSHDGLL